jgi:hypothetical protein
VEARDFAGYDPYDALNSPVLKFLSARSPKLRISFHQVLRRLPLNLRPLLGIQPGHNPKGLGLLLAGYSLLHRRCPTEETRSVILRLLALLEEYRTRTASGHGWGYNFDWQNKVFWAPKYTPTVVNSAFVGHALLDCYEATGDPRALDLAVPVRDFMVKDLNRIPDSGVYCLSYTPLDRYAVHNANMLGGSFLIRIAQLTSNPDARDCALMSLSYTMRHQRPDGSWPFSEQHGSTWVDSFHTGFVLEAIRWFLALDEAAQYHQQYDLGVQLYASKFFLKDGTPKYYHDRMGPIDIHCPAQAIAFFSGEGPEHAELTDCVLGWMLTNMLHPDGYFRFRMGGLFRNNIPYMRWSQAWSFHALARYVSSRSSWS